MDGKQNLKTCYEPFSARHPHAVYRYEFGDPKLSTPAGRIFKDAEAGRAVLIIHPVVLAEFYWLLKKMGLQARFQLYVQFIQTNPIYRFETITLDDMLRLGDFGDIPEMHDRLIAIVAERLGATIITRDPQILASKKSKCVW